MEPSKYDIFVSMAMREIENFVSKTSLGQHPLFPVVSGYMKDFVLKNPGIRNFIETKILCDSDSLDAGTEILKEDLSSKLDDFNSRLKQKLELNKE